MKKTMSTAKDIWLMLSLALVVLWLGELGLSLAFLIKNHLTRGRAPTLDYRVHADAYLGASWVRDHYEEFYRTDVEWVPYVYWRRKPLQGRYININSDGVRLTYKADTSRKEARTPVTVFMFGGSTMWGTGVRDGFTIPSLLAKALGSKEIAYEITNFGESGYVSTQEVITLLLQLQQGNVPDIVIFYDGINDTFSAYQQQAAGLPQNEFNRVKEFNLTRPDKLNQLREMVLQDAVRRLSTWRFLRGLLARLGVEHASDIVVKPSPASTAASDTTSLAHDVVTSYFKNLELVMALGERYHFKYLFYWQPTIFEKEHLTDYERGEQQKSQRLERFFQQTYDAIRHNKVTQKTNRSFRDLSMVFSNVREPLYIDWMHLGEVGNAIIAQQMARDVRSLGDRR